METKTSNLVQPPGPFAWTNNLGRTAYSGEIIVYGNCLGILLEDTEPDYGGNLDLLPGNVYSCPKAAGSMIGGGEALLYDVSEGVFRSGSEAADTGDILGAAVAASWAPPGETVVSVFLTPGNTTIAA